MALLSLWCMVVSGYGQILPLPLDHLIRTSQQQMIGQPTSYRVVKDHRDGMIYTIWTIQIEAWFSADGSVHPLVEVITPGGRLEHEEVHLCPMDEWELGRTYLFLTQPARSSLAPFGLESYPLLEPVAPVQGTLCREQAGYADGYSRSYVKESDLVTQIENLSGTRAIQPDGSAYQPGQHEDMEASLRMANITNIIDISGSQGPFYGGLADAQEEILILGSGFGTSGTIYFANADNGGMSNVTTLSSNGEEVMMWKNDSIRVKVHKKATTGNIRVNTSNNVARTIDWALNPTSSGGNRVQVELVDQNGNGGYTLSYHQNIINTSGAKDALNEAVEAWRCGSLVNWEVDDSGVTNGWNLNDGVNSILFDNNIPQGVLGQAQYSYLCNVQGNCRVCYLQEFGIRFPTSVTIELFPGFPIEYQWRFIDDPGGLWYDFPSVALHELGHVHGLNHGVTTDVMYYSLLNNIEKSVLTSHAEEAGEYVMAESVDVNCLTPPDPMIALLQADCELQAQPLAVELLSFRGEVQGKDHLLTWETASEVNTEAFNLEWQHGDHGRFQEIQTTPPSGTSNSGSFYSFVHRSAGPGTHYYRLSELETNGKTHYLGIIALDQPGVGLTLFPQPASGILSIMNGDHPSQVVTLQIRDVSGRLVDTHSLILPEKDQVSIDISSLTSGIYTFDVTGPSIRQTMPLLVK